MSFSLGFVARSRSHALQLLEQQKSSLPASVHAFLKTGIENLGPVSGHELRAVDVSASGHLSDGGGSYSISSATLKVAPTYIPD